MIKQAEGTEEDHGPTFRRIEFGGEHLGDVEESLPRVVMVVEKDLSRHAIERTTYHNVALLDADCKVVRDPHQLRSMLALRALPSTERQRMSVLTCAHGESTTTIFVEAAERVTLKRVINIGEKFDRSALRPSGVVIPADVRALLEDIVDKLRGSDGLGGQTSQSFQCRDCGYEGKFSMADCACYDEYARSCSAKFPGPGCSNGTPFCPVCEDGMASMAEKATTALAELERLLA